MNTFILKVLAMILYFKFHFFPYLLLLFFFSSLEIPPVFETYPPKQSCRNDIHIQCKRAKYFKFELIFPQA